MDLPIRSAREVKWGEIKALEMTLRLPLRGELFQVYCFRAGGLLIDCGPPKWARLVHPWLAPDPPEALALSHHHEDHSGNAAMIREQFGCPVFAAEATSKLMAQRFPMLPYRLVLFGRPRSLLPEPFPEPFTVGNLTLEVIPTPGHSADHMAFYERNRGWLFPGDLYLGDKVRVGKKEESIPGQIHSLRMLLNLNFDALFCAHKPIPSGGKAHLQAKLNFFVSVQEQVLHFHRLGLPVREIMRRLHWPEKTAWKWLTTFDVSGEFLIRSVITGSGEAE